MDTLDKKIENFLGLASEDQRPKLPDEIGKNLRTSISLRPYQQSALQNFLVYMGNERLRQRPAHLLFHMATGSGKTVIMASLIIYLYKQGYRNFLFFVNSSNIIEKTKENFLNPASGKYLFSDSIIIDGDKVNIREVVNFDEAAPEDINIHFTTIQGLHSRLNAPRENAITYEDFDDKKLVLISDEAHHINTLTKTSDKRTAQEEQNQSSWEYTVQKIFNLNKDNCLLEFTATIDIGNENIREKYSDKIIYDYPLKQFRLHRYSKEIELRQSFIDPVERMFQAIIFSQYRRKIAAKHGLSLKPVVMMKSNKIADSEKNMENFIKLINNLSPDYIKEAKEKAKAANDDSLTKIYNYLFEDLRLTYENFILEIKEDFSSDKIINVNDDKKLNNYQVKVNSLEEDNNETRVIFAVNKLNEGWDVLNLFDIVRLYDTRDTRNNKPGKTTMQEAQLIGRGARYCPFIDPDPNKADDSAEKRKYDKDLENPLRCLEELYYHCSRNSEYISEIKAELQKTGMMDKPTPRLLKVKDSFKETELYNKGVIYMNSRIANTNADKKSLSDYGVKCSYEYPYYLTSATQEERAIGGDPSSMRGTANIDRETYTLNEFGDAILQRVVDGNKYYYFDNIAKLLPNVRSMRDFFQETQQFIVKVKGDRDKIQALTPKDKKEITRFVFGEIETQMRNNSTEYKGSREFIPCEIQQTIIDKNVFITDSNRLAQLKGEGLFDKEWYVYEENLMNDLEKSFVKYINDKSDEIKRAFNFYLIRNEKIVKIYDFDTGKGFEPDFIIFLESREKKENLLYQLFIEAKGEHLEGYDDWKNKFLEYIEQEERAVNLYDNNLYKIIGLPFYTEEGHSFKDKFEAIIAGR